MTMTANGLAKLIEECGELQQIAAKKLAYFHTDEHPDGAGSMSQRMEDELADVAAACTFVVQQFGLDGERIRARAALKLDRFQKWHAKPDEYPSAAAPAAPSVPAQAVTLTDSVIDDMARESGVGMGGVEDPRKFARAIELRLLSGSAKTGGAG